MLTGLPRHFRPRFFPIHKGAFDILLPTASILYACFIVLPRQNIISTPLQNILNFKYATS
jgi:hypothetical protein